MENTAGTSPLEALELTEGFDGKSDQDILELIAKSLQFTTESGQSIKGDTGQEGGGGSSGQDGADGITPQQTVDAIPLADTVASHTFVENITEVAGWDLKLVWTDTATSPIAPNWITHYQLTLLGTQVKFNIDIDGLSWVLQRARWTT